MYFFGPGSEANELHGWNIEMFIAYLPLCLHQQTFRWLEPRSKLAGTVDFQTKGKQHNAAIFFSNSSLLCYICGPSCDPVVMWLPSCTSGHFVGCQDV